MNTINNYAFTVLEPSAKQVEYDKIYAKMFLNHFWGQLGNITQLTKDQTKKAIYWGVRGLPLLFNEGLKKDLSNIAKNNILDGLIATTRIIEELIAKLTPNELITIFPIEKCYNSNKYEVKDYYTTIGVLNKIGMDRVIGDNVTALMRDYINDYFCNFIITKICILSALSHIQGKKIIMEKLSKKNGIPCYEFIDCPNGREFMYDPQNYNIYKSKSLKMRPRRLSVI